MSKQGEMMVVLLLSVHMTNFDLHKSHHLAYRPLHSCENVQIHVQNDIPGGMGNQRVGVMLLLNL